ncbi:helix-turn-helix domain-containing protein [Serratia fonticola]|uniref:helix-turn-helix domain-containing protein n=1 Tax=Serratia fonticola TaxID=47917 RepID=UPI000BA2B6BC|nr:helix-turn-helix transcriptional regulator [Serratia fonticola]PAA94961.1 hypothetical protein CJJ13_24725 [Serratia fonticola]
MNIYIITENNYFFIGLKHTLKNDKNSVEKLSPYELEISPENKFKQGDIFIFHTSNYSLKLSFLISTGHFPGKLFFIPTNGKVRFKEAFSRYSFLDAKSDLMTVFSKVFDTQQKSIEQTKIFRDELTEREKNILHKTINGMNAQTISRLLCISVKTVYTHRRNALHKLGGRNLFEIWPFKEKILQTIAA